MADRPAEDRISIRSGLFGQAGARRSLLSRPTRVRGPIPWDDLRWWAVRRYRAVMAEGEVPFGPWVLTLPAPCGVSRARDETLVITLDELKVVVARPDGAPPPLEGGQRWGNPSVAGTALTTGGRDEWIITHDLTARDAPSEHLRIVGRSSVEFDRHVVDALAATARYEAVAGPGAGVNGVSGGR